MPAKCPPGETYNQSIKACRPKKKAGRKAVNKTKKNSPKKVASPKKTTSPKKVVISMDASPEKKMDGSGIVKWYTENGYLQDFLNDCSIGGGEMIYNKTTRLYEISFVPNASWPKTLERQVSEAEIYLTNPDDDGNYPIDGHVVTGVIRSINGVKVV
jgi:hypothetical protein